MCRTTEYYHHSNNNDERFIRLKSVSVSLSNSKTEENDGSFLPKSLTLVFLPRINGSFLEINASKYRPDSTAFVTLHRSLQSDSVFTSYDEIRACDGVVFEVHIGENRLLHGVLRRQDDGVLAMEVKSVLRKDCGVREAEICFTSENGVVLRNKVEVVVKRKKRSKFCRRRFEVALDEIPEERESDVTEEEEEESGGVCCCSCGEGESVEDEDQMVEMELEMEKEIEGVKWAVDVGIWAVCLGVGFFVTRASARNLRRRRKFLL